MNYFKEYFFIFLLFCITFLNLFDFYFDWLESEHNILHLSIEIFIILISIGGISFLIKEAYQRQLEIENLQKQLQDSHANIDAINHKIRQASRQYVEVIQEQFEHWSFSPSEKDVALLLLKGLSFGEIAQIRKTKEKTVRLQATAIYRKSGLNGRHTFAAWFFEDFLQQSQIE